MKPPIRPATRPSPAAGPLAPGGARSRGGRPGPEPREGIGADAAPRTTAGAPRSRGTARRAALRRLAATAVGASLALPLTAPATAWTDLPLETLGDTHRVREGHVAPPGDIAADAERAARGVVIGATPAHAALRRAAERAPFVVGHAEETWVADIGVLLRRDADGDGFFGAMELSIDVDTTAVEREVYAVIDLFEPYGALTLSHVTRTFTIRGNAASDEYRIEIELLDNHPAAYRDVAIEIRDAWSDDFLDGVSAAGFASLAALPLEAERAYGPLDDGPYHPVGHDDYALGVLLTGSSSHTDHGHYHDDDAYVAGYAAAGGPLGAAALIALALVRHARRREADSI